MGFFDSFVTGVGNFFTNTAVGQGLGNLAGGVATAFAQRGIDELFNVAGLPRQNLVPTRASGAPVATTQNPRGPGFVGPLGQPTGAGPIVDISGLNQAQINELMRFTGGGRVPTGGGAGPLATSNRNELIARRQRAGLATIALPDFSRGTITGASDPPTVPFVGHVAGVGGFTDLNSLFPTGGREDMAFPVSGSTGFAQPAFFDITVPSGGSIGGVADPRSAFRATMAGHRATKFMMANPTSGKMTWFGPLGEPVLFRGDFQAAKRVKRVARLAARKR